ncbi:hypothetical protein GCM10010187_04600 [Actinomadura coerulea]|nr:hypothetical protein GCM10010187_04600 [Actinomadura coerulea]
MNVSRVGVNGAGVRGERVPAGWGPVFTRAGDVGAAFMEGVSFHRTAPGAGAARGRCGAFRGAGPADASLA